MATICFYDHFLTPSQNEKPQSVDTSGLFYELSTSRAMRSGNEVFDVKKEGLGRLPLAIPSISSILLFNSDEVRKLENSWKVARAGSFVFANVSLFT